MDLKDLAYRFWEAPVQKLFSDIRASAFPRIEVPQHIAEELNKHLVSAAGVCSSQWDSSQPVLYRARKNHYGQLEKFTGANMGPPPSDAASAGRAQPAGVAMLYLADTVQTAIAEVKPDTREYLTVGTFRVRSGSTLRVLDLTRFDPALLSYPLRERFELIELSRRAFSAPVHPSDPRKYHAHAYFVQKVRDLGYDGIGYQSAVEENGRCFAFFDSSHFRCTQTRLHQALSVSVRSERVSFSLLEKQHIASLKSKRKVTREKP